MHVRNQTLLFRIKSYLAFCEMKVTRFFGIVSFLFTQDEELSYLIYEVKFKKEIYFLPFDSAPPPRPRFEQVS